MFLGESRHPVDAKHRVFLPKKFHQLLPVDEDGDRVAVLARGFGEHECLDLFTVPGFERATSRMNTDAFTDPEQRRLQRIYFSNTSRVTLDASGRLLLPEKLRKLAGIEREVVFVGVMDRIEIWSAEQWDVFEQTNEDKYEEVTGVLRQPGDGREAGA
ncbi:MAG: division/cell wall cluster transcriptional repressor MraZ [Planctomycetota bacterium]|nr:MAG: division/cell wall cluster transcriptional repressor MraZ [Planctomycetota bacterium]